MTPADNIEKLISEVPIDTSTETDKAVLGDVLKILENTKRTTSAELEPNIGRMIMKSKLTKLGTAAAVVTASLIAASILLDSGVKQAYAIDQTIREMRKVTTVHCFGTMEGARFEMWISVNPQTGENEQLYLDTKDQTTVESLKGTYWYDKRTNVVRYQKGHHVDSGVRFGRFIEDMVQLVPNGETEIKEVYDSDKAKPVILLVTQDDSVKIKCRVDPGTKLPLSIDVEPKNSRARVSWGPGQSADEIYYNQPLPEGIFEFEIPEGARVIEG